MNRMGLNIKFQVILVLLILFILCGCRENNAKYEQIQIFEINNTEEIYDNKQSGIITINKHYMIIKPPDDLYELKNLVEEFYKDKLIDEHIKVDRNKRRQFTMYFYRKSEKLPVDWQPSDGYFDTDRIEYHKDDLIVSIYWSDSNPQKEYYVMKKSMQENNYGAVIERLEFINEKVIE